MSEPREPQARALGEEVDHGPLTVEQRRFVLVQWVGFAIYVYYAAQAVWFEHTVATAVDCSASVLALFSILHFRRHRDLHLATQALLLGGWFAVGLSPLSDGMRESKGLYLIALLPLSAAHVLGARQGYIWGWVACLTIISVSIGDFFIDLPMEWDPGSDVEWIALRVVGLVVFTMMAVLDAARSHRNLWELETQGLALSRANKDAQAASEAKTAFLARVSHEIRTPMHGVLGMTQMLQDEPLSAEDLERVDTIHRCAENLQHLLNDVLDLSKIEGGTLEVHRTSFALRDMIEDTCTLFAARARFEGVTLRPMFPDEHAVAWGDPLRVRQILSNLVGNALKFGEGGEVRVVLRCVLDRVLVEVEDEGIGMTQEEQAALFSAYNQLERGQQQHRGGSGLGLTISQDLARSMGGEITVRSQLGLGSTFTLNLARSTADISRPEVRAKTSEAKACSAFQGREALVVDDNEVNRRVACVQLRALGFQVHEAKDGAVAVRMASSQRFALILMDLQMPQMDGLAATRAIRSDSCNKDTPIVAVTANAFPEDRARCEEAGMNGHLAKPFRAAELRSLCEQMLGPDRCAAA